MTAKNASTGHVAEAVCQGTAKPPDQPAGHGTDADNSKRCRQPGLLNRTSKTATASDNSIASAGLSSTPAAIIDHCAQRGRLPMSRISACGSQGQITHRMATEMLVARGEDAVDREEGPLSLGSRGPETEIPIQRLQPPQTIILGLG
jgi:hypothetical protein